MAEDFRARFKVGWGDLDGNAHMANTAFLDHAADTRLQYFAAHGFPASRLAKERFGPVVLHDDVVYRKELRLFDEYTVDLEVVGSTADGGRFRLRNTFRDAAGDVCAVVTSEGVWFDLDARKPRLPPAELLAVQQATKRAPDYQDIVRRVH